MDDIVNLSDSPTFDVLVLGCGGGPLETNLSCYLFKPYGQPWSNGCTSVEGGSGLGSLVRLLETLPESFKDFELPSNVPLANAGWVLSLIRSFLISHAHLDHISGLVLAAGMSPALKNIYGSTRTLQNLSHVFDGGVWPHLASFEGKESAAYVYRTIETPSTKKVSIEGGLKVRAYNISHGSMGDGSAYDSTAFFLSIDDQGREVLFFGDVEPDSVSSRPNNRQVWYEASERIKLGKLSTIFIECSWTSSRSKSELYGHLSPPFLYEELSCLASFLPSTNRSRSSLRGRLKALNCCIIHVKDTFEEGDSSAKIRLELNALESKFGLGIKFTILKQGMRLRV